jgi:hypothetical protein
MPRNIHESFSRNKNIINSVEFEICNTLEIAWICHNQMHTETAKVYDYSFGIYFITLELDGIPSLAPYLFDKEWGGFNTKSVYFIFISERIYIIFECFLTHLSSIELFVQTAVWFYSNVRFAHSFCSR